MVDMPVVGGVTGPTSPAAKAIAIVPNDSTIIACRALFVGTGGNINALLIGDTAAQLFKNVPSGSMLDIACQKVLSTNTTAADILGLL